MSDLQAILGTKPNYILSVPPTTTVLAAVDEMCRRHIGALLVLEWNEVIGIVSEGDVMTRVVLHGLDPGATFVANVMTSSISTIDVDSSAEDAMRVMTEQRCHHLPVLRDGEMVGLISLGDLVRWSNRNQAEEIHVLHEYVSGPCACP